MKQSKQIKPQTTPKHRLSFYSEIRKNKIYSTILIIAMFFVLILLGFVIGLAMGPDYFLIIMIAATIFSIVYIVAGYYKSHNIALASVKAKKATPEKYSQYHHTVEGLCIASGIPKPKLYVMEEKSINAFASGRNPEKAVICVTTGALEKLDKQELEGVLSHELSHIANYDIRFMTLAAVLIGMISIISQIFLRSLFWSSLSGRGGSKNNSNAVFLAIGIGLAILAPIAVSLVRLAISRKREYSADATGVKMTRSPTGLTRALEKIKTSAGMEKKVSGAVSPLFISNPSKMQVMFATHPPLEKRIARLRRM